MTQQQTPAVESGEWAALAGLRFLLAAGVLIGHVCMMFPVRCVLTLLGGPSPFVLGFFVVSGYSIAASVGRHVDYCKRRAIRILPVYYICLAIAVAAMYTWPHHGHLPKRMLLVNILLLQGYFNIAPFYGFGQSWTLVCEVAYYAVAPVLNRLKVPLLLILAGASAAWYAHALTGPCSFYLLPAGLATGIMAWSWLIGFVYYKHRTRRWAQWLLFLVFPLIGSLAYRLYNPHHILGRFLVLEVAALTIAGGRYLRLSPTVAKVLNYLGDVSYPLYLVHIPVLNAVMANHIHMNWMPACAIAIVAAVIVNAIDQPIQRRRKSTYASTPDTVAAADEPVLTAR